LLVGFDRRDQFVLLIKSRAPLILPRFFVLQNLDVIGNPRLESEILAEVIPHPIKSIGERAGRDPHLPGPPIRMLPIVHNDHAGPRGRDAFP